MCYMKARRLVYPREAICWWQECLVKALCHAILGDLGVCGIEQICKVAYLVDKASILLSKEEGHTRKATMQRNISRTISMFIPLCPLTDPHSTSSYAAIFMIGYILRRFVVNEQPRS